MLQAALLWYNKFRQELEKEGFEFNPYDPCVVSEQERITTYDSIPCG